jgi:ankyrin repeat protein
MIKLLIDKGANVNATDKDGGTALMKATDEGQADIVKLLIDKGADVSAKNNGGLTAADSICTDPLRPKTGVCPEKEIRDLLSQASYRPMAPGVHAILLTGAVVILIVWLFFFVLKHKK